MLSGYVIVGLVALALAYVILQRLTRPSLPKICGPKSSSFLFGNLLELFQSPIGAADFEWQTRYGNVVRFKDVFGGEQLWIADPKALQWIFNASGYRYTKHHNLRVVSRLVNGTGITWADGDVHKRQRKVLLPGFGGPELKTFVGIFKGCAESMCEKWMDIIEKSGKQTVVLNVPGWLSRGTLDAIGQAAFDIQFGALENDEHPLAKAYYNMLFDIFACPSTRQIFVQDASKYVPTRVLEWLADHLSNPRLERARKVGKVTTRLAKEMVREKGRNIVSREGEQGYLQSARFKANMDSEAKIKLTEEELLAQMRLINVIKTILFAGHETTSNSISWILLEIARHPKVQSKLRAEIRATKAAIRERGDVQMTLSDLDTMSYTKAVMKEGLRYHPVIPHIFRVSERDDIVPLSRPVNMESGDTINKIVVPKGTRIVASIAAYNRNRELWGDDAHEFNPDRWLDGVASEKKIDSVGVYSNLMTFIGGVRSCLGWRFAVSEIQVFLVEMVDKFEFTMTDKSELIRRVPSMMMIPMVEGELERKCQLPLAVSIAPREGDV